MVRMSRGMRKYSIVLASANEFGGMMQTSALMSTNDLGSKFFGSTMALKTLLNTLNSSPTRTSKPEEREAEHHQAAEARDDQTDHNDRLAHPLCPLCRSCRMKVQTRSMPGKKYPISYAAVSGASDPCVALPSIDSANSLRSVPASALAGSVAPISMRHFLIASADSSTITIAGPDDMNDVRLAKNGRSRCTA